MKPMNFKEFFFNEMPNIILQKKNVLADDKPLRDLDVTALKDNIVVFRFSKPLGPYQKGFTFVFFMDSKESADEMKAGKIPLLRVAVPHALSGFGGVRESPINDVWSQRMRDTKTTDDEPRIRVENGKEKKVKGTDKILGLLEALTNENEIHVSVMSVRKPFRKNTITAKMIQAIEAEFPKAKIKFDEPSDEGSSFIQKRYPDAEITKKQMWKRLGRF